MGPEARCRLGRDIVEEVDQRAVLDEQVSAVAAVEQIRIVFAGDHHAELFIQVAREELELEGDTELVFNLLIDLVVFRGLIAGIAAEYGQGNRLLCRRSVICERMYREQGGDHEGQGQRSCNKLLHTLFSSL